MSCLLCHLLSIWLPDEDHHSLACGSELCLELNDVALHLGDFHNCMAFLAVIGKCFRCAYLKDAVVPPGVVASGSAKAVLGGQHYN